MDKTKYQALINEIADSCPNKDKKDHYCFLKELLLLSKDPRTVLQIKAIEKYKFERSKELEKDIGWEKAAKEWAENYGEKFAKAYSEDKTFLQIYKEVRNGKTQ